MNNVLAHSHYKNYLKVLLLVILLLVLSLLAIKHLVQKKANLHLQCEANLYLVNNNRNQTDKLMLEVISQNKQVLLRYSHFVDQLQIGKFELFGVLKQLDIASMTYRIQIEKSQSNYTSTEQQIAEHWQQSIQQGINALSHNSFPVMMTLSQMDVTKAYATARFEPGNSIWGCKIIT